MASTPPPRGPDDPTFEDRVVALEAWFASLPVEQRRLLDDLADLDGAEAEPQRHHP